MGKFSKKVHAEDERDERKLDVDKEVLDWYRRSIILKRRDMSWVHRRHSL